MDSRIAALQNMFGDTYEIVEEPEAGDPPINVAVFAPTEEREFFTIVTLGLSDLAMEAPCELMFRRVELVLYAEEPDEGLVQLLWWLACIVRENKHWLNPGSTMPNGEPPEPLFDDSELDGFCFLQCLFDADFALPESLTIEGDPVSLLWAVPVTAAERQFLMDNDVDDFYELMEQNEHPLIFNYPRDSHC